MGAEGKFILDENLRDNIVEFISDLQKKYALCLQEKRQQKVELESEMEAFLLDLLEVYDTLDNIINYLSEHINTDSNSKFVQRLVKLLKSTQNKFINTLSKQGVSEIPLDTDKELDYSVCRVIEREIRIDLPDKTVTKVLRKGFYYRDKVLRTIDVITSQLEGSQE